MENAEYGCRTQKNHKVLQNFWGNEENLANFTVILMVAFGTKNVHSAFGINASVIFVRQGKGSTST